MRSVVFGPAPQPLAMTPSTYGMLLMRFSP